MKVTFDFGGGTEIEQALRNLGDRKQALRAGQRTLRQALLPMQATAKRRVPVDKGDLRDSLKIAAGKKPRGSDPDSIFMVLGIDSSVQPPRDVTRKSGKGTYRDPGVAGTSVIQEFGDNGQPFMTPAWDQNKGETPERIGELLWAEIEAAAKRIARRR